MRIDDRLRRLEEAAGSTRDEDAVRVDADHVLRAVERLASRLPSSAATMPLAERVATMSPAQHCAWEMRFAPEQTPVVRIMAMHGHAFPAVQPENDHAPR